MSDTFDDDPSAPPSGGNMSWVLPLATAVIALLLGSVVGGLGVIAWWRATPPQVETETVVQLRDLTDDELENMCNLFLTDTLATLTEAQAKVVDLEDKVQLKEAQIADMERTADQRSEAGRKMYAELQAARAELLTLREELDLAVAQKEEALVELERTVEELRKTEDELVETQGKLTVAQRDVLDNRWRGFVQNVQLEVCEKGRRGKMERCREAILAALDSELEQNFRYCIRSGQAVPGLREASKDMEDLPEYSQWLNEDERLIRGWFVTLCDPTLPEAPDFVTALQSVQEAEGGAPADPDESASDAIERALNDLDD